MVIKALGRAPLQRKSESAAAARLHRGRSGPVSEDHGIARSGSRHLVGARSLHRSTWILADPGASDSSVCGDVHHSAETNSGAQRVGEAPRATTLQTRANRILVRGRRHWKQAAMRAERPRRELSQPPPTARFDCERVRRRRRRDDAGILRRFRRQPVRAIGSTTNTTSHEDRPDQHHGVQPPELLDRRIGSKDRVAKPSRARSPPQEGSTTALAPRSAFQLLRIAPSPSRASSRAFARGNATSVMNATPPIQCVTKRTCNARASSMSSSSAHAQAIRAGGYARVYQVLRRRHMKALGKRALGAQASIVRYPEPTAPARLRTSRFSGAWDCPCRKHPGGWAADAEAALARFPFHRDPIRHR